MKKITILLLSLVLFNSCLESDNDAPNLTYEYLPIDEAITPPIFAFGETHTITVKYSLPDGCHNFHELYFDNQGTERIVAVVALKSLNTACTQAIIPEEHTFEVQVTQVQDYIFKFWKGKDSQGNDIYEEVVIPVD